MTFKMLDCFCGLGGASMGFAKEGFECTGIDVVNVGYPYRFMLADMLLLDGKDFRGYDVIWSSPPCRDFCELARLVGHKWKRPANPENGLVLVNIFLNFVNKANPRFWIMENNPSLAKYLPSLKPKMTKTLIGETMKRSFWGDFPYFLMPSDSRKKQLTTRNRSGKGPSHMRINGKIPKYESWERAKIPLACSQAFARACKQALLEKRVVNELSLGANKK